MSSPLLVATYDAIHQTFTCPYCRGTYPLHKCTLKEARYSRYWSLAVTQDGIVVTDDAFSDDGSLTYRVSHETQSQTASSCVRWAAVPDNFDWDWT